MKPEIENLAPDFQDWPKRWMGIEEDRAYGERLIKYLEPFISNLATSNLATKTKKKHIENLWLAGGELVRTISIDEDYEKDPLELLFESFDAEGGPYCQHVAGASDSYDSTCRKFHKYLEKNWREQDGGYNSGKRSQKFKPTRHPQS